MTSYTVTKQLKNPILHCDFLLNIYEPFMHFYEMKRRIVKRKTVYWSQFSSEKRIKDCFCINISSSSNELVNKILGFITLWCGQLLTMSEKLERL